MPLKAYGVLVGKIVGKRKAVSSSPHFQIKVEGENGVFYRIAVNVKSKVAPSEVKYFLKDNFQHELIQKIKLANLKPGFHNLTKAPNGLALDYIRYNLFRLEELVPLPFEMDGPNNDLNDHLDFFVTKAKEDDEAVIYAFGEPWGPETVKDKVFGFQPGRGIHDIHMNQGSEGEFKSTNGAVRKFGERAAINAPIQGTSSDLMKKAMIQVYENSPAPMLLQVHDELLFECPESEVEDAARAIKEIMEGVAQFKVPLKVNVAWGKNWEEAHA